VYRGAAGDGNHHHIEQRAATKFIGAIKWKKNKPQKKHVKKSNEKKKITAI